ncbi:hypothetical protein V3C99_007357 [Haemonchus contortus]
MEVEATFGIRLLASMLILIPALIGLGLHSLLALTLYRGWKTFYLISFYVITVQLQCCDVCALLLDLYIAFPLSLTGYQYMGDSIPLYYGPLFFEGIAFNGLFLFSFYMSISRFLIFVAPQIHNKIFSYWGTRIISLILWIYVFIFIGLSNFFGCRKQFAKDGFYFWYNCSNRVPGQFHYNDFMNIQAYFIPAAMIIMYVIIYVKIKVPSEAGTKSEMERVKKEIKFFLQTVLIGILIIVEVIAFVTLPYLKVSGYGQFYLNILLNLIIIANNLVTPIVIFSFNSDIQNYLSWNVIRYRIPHTQVVASVL